MTRVQCDRNLHRCNRTRLWFRPKHMLHWSASKSYYEWSALGTFVHATLFPGIFTQCFLMKGLIVLRRICIYEGKLLYPTDVFSNKVFVCWRTQSRSQGLSSFGRGDLQSLSSREQINGKNLPLRRECDALLSHLSFYEPDPPYRRFTQEVRVGQRHPTHHPYRVCFVVSITVRFPQHIRLLQQMRAMEHGMESFPLLRNRSALKGHKRRCVWRGA